MRSIRADSVGLGEATLCVASPFVPLSIYIYVYVYVSVSISVSIYIYA